MNQINRMNQYTNMLVLKCTKRGWALSFFNLEFTTMLCFVILLAKIKKSRSIDPGYIFGDFSCFFRLLFRNRFSHWLFLDLHGFGSSWGAWFGHAVAPGQCNIGPRGTPRWYRDQGSRGRSGWPRVTPGVASGRPVVQHHEFLCFSMALALHCSCFLHYFDTSFHTILTIYVSQK